MSKLAPDPQTSAARTDPAVILRAQAIRKSYQMGDTPLVILKNADLTLREGEFVAIEGRSGSGKSTLLHIMCGLDAADGGTLAFRGKEYAANPPGILYPTPFRHLLVISQWKRMLVYAVILASIILGFEVFRIYLTNEVARLVVPVAAFFLIAFGLLFKWERLLIGGAVAAILFFMGWITTVTHGNIGWLNTVVYGNFWFGSGTGVVVVVAFFIYLAIAGYIAERPVCRLRNTEFGFVFQFYHLLPELNVLENAMMAAMVERSWFSFRLNKSELRDRAIKILTDLGLDHRLKHKPNQLSGGERQRVAIARALMNSPKILFADEPTGNLDYETGRQIMGVLEKLHQEKGQTIVMVTHDRSLASQADRVLVLKNGKLEKPAESPGPADKVRKLDYRKE